MFTQLITASEILYGLDDNGETWYLEKEYVEPDPVAYKWDTLNTPVVYTWIKLTKQKESNNG